MAPSLHIAMYPWFALGHFIAFLNLANKLAKKGHTITFFTPEKFILQLQPYNLHPDHVIFHPISVPDVNDLPPGAQTCADIPSSSRHHLRLAFDLTCSTLRSSLSHLLPDLIIFHMSDWITTICQELRIKTVMYCPITATATSYLFRPLHSVLDSDLASEMKTPPVGFPHSSTSIKLSDHEARVLAARRRDRFPEDGVSFGDRVISGLEKCDAICVNSCKEMEGDHGCAYLEQRFGRPVIMAGPMLPEPLSSSSFTLDAGLLGWLNKWSDREVVYCALGSQCTLQKNQFQELLLGLELTGMPFLAALKTPTECEAVGDALPDGFTERSGERGMVYRGWVQQQEILNHRSVGCFVTHCGFRSLTEGLVSECQMVFLPQGGDQFINARMFSRDLRVGVEVERGESDGEFNKMTVSQAVRAVMLEDSEVGNEVSRNHDRWRELLLSDGFEESYMNGLIQGFQGLVGVKSTPSD